MEEAVLNKISAEIAAVLASCKEIHAQFQVSAKTITDVKEAIRVSAKGNQPGTKGVAPVTSTPQAATSTQRRESHRGCMLLEVMADVEASCGLIFEASS